MKRFDRRDFLVGTGYAIGLLGLNSFHSCSGPREINIKQHSLLQNIQIIDAHSHPGGLHRRTFGRPVHDRSSSIEQMNELGMEASVFATLGDFSTYGHGSLGSSDFALVSKQLDYLLTKIDDKQILPVLTTSDIPLIIGVGKPPGAILGIEGGNSLEGKLSNLEIFYNKGVRIITLVHHLNNDIGDSMTSIPKHLDLTVWGTQVVDKMQELGMVIDVAHMSYHSLKKCAAICKKPVIDSHTNVVGYYRPKTRIRSYEEVEWIVKTGGLVCTWPLGYATRNDIKTWAREIVELKRRFGIEHIGLGTDGSGSLPKFVSGYKDIRDLVKLAEAMNQEGLTKDEIAAFMGGNFKRVFQQCVG